MWCPVWGFVNSPIDGWFTSSNASCEGVNLMLSARWHGLWANKRSKAWKRKKEKTKLYLTALRCFVEIYSSRWQKCNRKDLLQLLLKTYTEKKTFWKSWMLQTVTEVPKGHFCSCYLNHELTLLTTLNLLLCLNVFVFFSADDLSSFKPSVSFPPSHYLSKHHNLFRSP